MFENPSQFEPLLIEDHRPIFQDLLGRATDLLKETACLEAVLPLATQISVAELVVGMNCYYSNLIEGHRTLPLSIEKVLQQDFSKDRIVLERQSLALAHISTAKWAIKQSPQKENLNDFILQVHRRFCEQLPENMLILEDGRKMVPGKFRDGEVIVGRHVPPVHTSLPKFLNRFTQAYGLQIERSSLSTAHQMKALISMFCSHHRFVWIHPFYDGNGRVARILLDSMMAQIGVNKAGLWSMSRGFAKEQEKYKNFLANADSSRRGDLDGRGNLSEKSLVELVEFSFDTAIDQVKYMRKIFDFDNLEARANHYFKNVRLDLRPESVHIFIEAVRRGEIERGEVPRLSGLKERTGRDALSQLIKEGFLLSETSKGKLRAGFPVKSLGTLLPNLYPSGDVDLIAEDQPEVGRRRLKP